jgi:uncharacterized membrane protein
MMATIIMIVMMATYLTRKGGVYTSDGQIRTDNILEN